MTQNVPPRGQDPEGYSSDDAARAPASGSASFDDRDGPYGSRVRDEPDLDAGAPVLRSSEVQRLNRKALMFLAGIVALLVIAIVWSLNQASGDDEPAAKAPAARVTIPDAPAPALPPPEVQPIAVQQDLPPLPSDPSLEDARVAPVNQAPPQPTGPSLMDRRMMNGTDSASVDNYGGNPNVPGAYPGDPNAPAMAGQEKPTSAQFIRNPDVLLVRGTYIRCVLETRIVTDIPGFTSCIVTEPVYSINGRRLLLPKGSKVLGKYEGEPRGPRVAVIWDRITTPNGLDVSMKSPGVDGLGGAGHPGNYSAHWGSRITSALLISLIADAFKYAAAENGPQSSTVGAGGVVLQQPYESATARSMERLANQALDNRRPPTVTINQGTVVNVYVARDVDFSGVIAKF